MCLIDNKRFRFTFKKIPVYKVVEVLYSGKLVSPFRYFAIKRTCSAQDRKLFPKKTSIGLYDGEGYMYEFDTGYIHAYTSVISACSAECELELRSKISPQHYGRTYKIIEGYIPPFTRYAKDISTGDICARKMIFPDL